MNSYNIICPYFLKKRILESIEPTDRVKFYTLEDVEGFLLPTFSVKAIEYVYINYAKGNLSYALTLIKSLKYIKSKVSFTKTEELLEIYRDLQSHDLVERDEISKRILKKNPVKIVGYPSLEGLLSLLADNQIEYEVLSEDKFISLADKRVYKFENKREELIETVNLIGKLLDEKISYKDIGVVCPNSDMSLLNLIGNQVNVKFSYSDIDLKVNLLTERAVNLLEENKVEEFLNLLKPSSNIYDNTVKTHILNTYNKLLEDKLDNDFFLTYFKYLITNAKIKSREGISLVSDVERVSNLSHVFLLNFDEKYPKIYKNSDYLFDEIKSLDTYMEQSVNLNQAERAKLLMILSNIDNLYIFLPENDEITGAIFPSSVIEEEKIILQDYPYHDGIRLTYTFDQLDYAIMNANFIDYGVSSNYYLLLEDIFKDTYVKYSPNDKKITCEFDTSKLKFSYSSMTTYAKCPFLYLIEKIYRINDTEDHQIMLDIGTMCHYFLEKYVSGEEISFEEAFSTLEKDYDSYSVQDKFYLKKSYEEVKEFSPYLHEFLDGIGDGKNLLTEHKFDIKLQDKYNITGVIDLIVEDDLGFLIFDYKTGNHTLDENDVINGFDMQLPFYTYVAKNNLMPKKKPYGMFYITLLQPDSISQYYDSFKFKGLKLDISEFFDHVADIDVVQKYISNRATNVLTYDELNSKMLDKIDEIIKGVQSFDFPVTKKVYVNADGSRRASQCQYCNYRDVCFVDDNSKQVIEIEKIKDEKEAEEE